MKNVSNNFKNVISKGGPFYAYAKIVLRDGTELELDSTDDFYIDGNSYNESGGDGFPLGVALSKTIDIGIENSNERYSGYDFYYSRITLYTEADLEDGTKERILEGTFTVIDPVAPGDTIEITASDDMYKSDVPYASKLTYPATTRAILQEACSQSSISLSSAAFENDDFIVQTAPQELTCRQVIGCVAMIAGGNAVMSENNQLIIKTYRFPVFDSKKILSGGRFGQELKDMVSGGDFTQEYGNTVSGGEFGESDNYIVLSEFSSDPDISTDDVVITGISTTVKGEGQEKDQEFLYGTDDYAIKIENPLIEGKEETAIALIGDLLIGTIARPFSGEFFPDPTVQFMDPVYLVDRKDNIYQSFVTSLTFTYLGNSNISNGLKSPEMNKSTYYSAATEVYRKARQDIQKNKTEWEKAAEDLGNRIDNASGLYPTEEKQPDGSTIYYLHDKPTLEESEVVIKITAQAIGISTDGGKTYPTGLTVDGEAIIKILQTVGVNADWINTGAIRVTDDDGNIIFSVDMDTKQVIISGDSVRIGGKTATAAIDDVLQESKDYSDGKLANFADTVTENLSSLQAQVDGQIETFYEDYEPSLQNYPASEWTTTEERKKHEGDLFYWKSKGYAYRFFQDGATWKWQLVKDTDITQAMAAAEKAQDTADGKRRVFVVTPQPPYDIGDLWTNGEDILTCSTARPAGSVYVSTDWEKLNTYTDDTLANEALEEARKARNLNMILDNEFQGIYTDYSGNIASFPAVSTTVQVLYGHTDVSVNCTYSIEKSASITGSWSNATRTYTVTGLSADSGWVDITASYLNLFTVTKRFKVEKIKGGEPGEEGQQGEQGVSVTGTDLTYQVSSNGTSIPTGFWSSSIPQASPGQYLWTRTQFNYSDDSHSYSYSVGKIGENGVPGQNGTDGRGISSTEIAYQASTSGTVTPTGAWTSSVPSVSAGQYLWTRTITTYTDETTTTSYSVGKMGENGAAGTPARIFMIEPSVNLLKRSKDDTISPNFIEFKSYYRDGDNANRVAYSGRWVIEETADGDSWNTIYTSSSDENTVIHYVYSLFADSDGSAIASSNGDTIGIPRDVVAIRAKLYASGGTTNLLDMQSVSVVVDVDALTHDEIFDLLTDNGKIKGIYKEGNQLYISFTYAKGGTLTLGGVNNGDGELTILDSSGNQIGYAGNTGVRFGKGTFLGTIYGYEARIQKSILMSTKPEGSSDIEVDSDYIRAASVWNANIGGTIGYSLGIAMSEANDAKRCIGISLGDRDLLDTTIHGDVLIGKDLNVGGGKNRLVKTESFGERKLSCYEMTSPMFGDIGTAETDEDGECVIYIDDVFYETVSPGIEYQVFLQKEGQGDLWVSQKNATYFCVNGTPNLKFSWEIKIKQRDYEYNRLNPNIPVDKAIGVESLLPTSITRDLEELLK